MITDRSLQGGNKRGMKDRDTVMRYLAMLSSIPMEPAQVSTKFPLVSKVEGKANYWSFKKGSSSQWPAMTLDAALGILLVENNLKEQMPLSVANSIAPLVGQARATLDTLDKSGYKKVLVNCLRVIPKGFVLQKPEIAPDVLNKILESLAKKRQLMIELNGKDATINPLGLVVRGTVLYLVCTFDGYTECRMPAVHRIKQANVLLSTELPPINSAVLDHKKARICGLFY
jgi:hypothetical protein